MITIFHEANGAITDFIESDQLTPDDVTNLTPPGGGYILSDDYPDGETQYVSAGALADRPEIDVEPDWVMTGDGTDSVWFEAPDETEVLVTRQGSTVLVAEGITEDEGLVTFTSVVSGRFILLVTPPWPWQVAEITVDVGGPESDDVSETPPGSPATVLSFDLAMPVLEDLEVLDKPKFNRADWDVSKWPFHAYYELTRYGTESDALADVNGVLIGPITDSFYKDADNLANGLVWYRVNDVDDLDNRSPKSDPVSVTARGAKDTDIDQTAPATPTMTLVGYGDDFDKDGTLDAGLVASITHPNTGVEIGSYIVRMQRANASDGPWTDWGGPINVPAEDVADTLVSVLRIKANAKKWFRARVRSVARLSGKKGAFSGYTEPVQPTTATGFSGTPDAPTVGAVANGFVIKWAKPADPIYFETQVLANGIGLQRVNGNFLVDTTTRSPGATVTYTVRHFDVLGGSTNESTGAVSPAYRGVNNTELDDGAVTRDKILDGEVIAAKIAAGAINTTKLASAIRAVEVVAALPASGNVDGRMAYLTTDKKLYRYVSGTGWTAAIDTSDLTGTISDGQIAGLAAAKITGQLTNDQIAAIAAAKMTGTITGTQIADNVISTAKLQAGSVTTAILAAGSVSAEKLTIGSGANMLSNSDILAGKTGWGFNWSTNPAKFQFNLRTDTYAAGGIALEIIQTNGDAGEEYGIWPVDAAGNPINFAVAVSKWYELSTYYLGHRATGLQLYVQWLDGVEGHISYSSLGTFAASQGTNPNKQLAGYARAWAKVQAPAGAVFARPFFRHKGTLQGFGYTSSYIWLKRFFFAEANANQTEPTPWSEGGLTFVQGGNIVTGAITADHIAALTITGSKIQAGTISADKLVANSITAGQIAVGAIGANQIAAGAISASKIAIGALSENLLLDDSFESGTLDLWLGAGGTATVVGNTTAPNGGKVLSLNRGVTDNSVTMNRTYANFIPVDTGKQYRCEFNIMGPVASATGAYLRVLYFDANKAAVVDPATGLNYRDLWANGAIPGAWTTYGATFTMPAVAKYAKVMVYHHSTSTVAVMLISSISLRKLISGDLIVTGSITATHIASYNLTAANATIGNIDISNANIGTLTVGALNLADNAVIPRALQQRDFGNLVRDPNCIDLSVWRAGTNTINLVSLPSATAVVASNMLQAESTPASNTVLIEGLADIPISATETYYISAWIGAATGFSATEVKLQVERYSVVNGVITSSTGWETIKTESAPGSSIKLLAGSIFNLGLFINHNRMAIRAVITGASGSMKGIMTAPSVKKLSALHENISSSGTYGSFGTAEQTLQTLQFNHGLAASSVTVFAAFRNISSGANTYTVRLTANGVQFSARANYQVSNNGYCEIFGTFSVPEINPSAYTTAIDLKAQAATGSNDASHRRIVAISNSD